MRLKYSLKVISKVLAYTLSGALLLVVIILTFRLGYNIGFVRGKSSSEDFYLSYISDLVEEKIATTREPAVVNPKITPTPTRPPTMIRNVEWGGPQLWEAVNKRRIELGVNPLRTDSDLCTIASIRLNELLELGKLDGHEGFTNMDERRPDLKWIFEKFSTVAEFLVAGAGSPEEAVSLWENTLGHKQLLSGGEYVWGCIYAQNSFGVAITAY